MHEFAGETNSSLLQLLAMGSLVGALRPDDAAEFVNGVGGGGGLGGVIYSALSRETIVSVLQQMWRSPRGREVARAHAYGSLTWADRRRTPVVLACQRYLEQTSLGTALPPRLEAWLWKFANTGYEMTLQTGTLVLRN